MEITFESPMPVPAEALFAWHARPGAFMRLAPPWAPIALEHFDGIRPGDRAVIRLGPVGLRWVAEHEDYIEGRQFVDVQRKGPFRRWRHTHRMEPAGPEASRLVDHIAYALPFGALGQALGGAFVRKQVAAQFAYRHRLTADDLATHQRYNPEGRRLRLAVTGASGLLGKALVAFLTTGGHTVLRLVRRRPTAEGEVYWNVADGEIDATALDGLDAVIHLAGENVFAWRWTDAKKRRIHESRVRGTRLLAKTLAVLPRPPRVLLTASGIGYYGDRGDEQLTEASSFAPGGGFLADVVRDWEHAAAPAPDAGIRTAHLRIGVVLSPQGGALAQMLPPFRLGLGGPLGSGRQYLSWIALDDVLGAIYHILWTDALAGPVNVTAPNPVTMRTFAKTLGHVLRRPAVVRIPAAALRLALGEVAEETILPSARVLPERLADTGYAFRIAHLDPALRYMLGKARPAEGFTVTTSPV